MSNADTIPAHRSVDEALWAPLAMVYRVSRRRPLLFDVLIVVVLDIVTSIPLIVGPEDRWWVWVLDQALILPLVMRRRWPFGVFLLLSAVAFLQWLLNDPLAADAGLLLALYTIASQQTRSRALISAAVLEGGVVLASVRFAPASDGLAGSLVFLSGLVVAALLGGIALSTHGAYLASMIDRNRRLELERDQQARLAAAAERTRIAREMHDIVAHSISVIIALADGAALTNRAGDTEATEAMRAVSETARTALVEMRRLLGVLRDDSRLAGEIAPQPGLDQLDELAQTVRRAGLPVDMIVIGQRQRLIPTAEATVYRIIQEALTNVLKHAVGAGAVIMTLEWSEHELVVDVTDDGEPHNWPRHQGDPAQRSGHGLIGMSERLAMFGGTVSARPTYRGGWQVRARLPIDATVALPSPTPASWAVTQTG